MNKIQAVLIVTLLLAVQGLVVMAHGGEDHEEKKEATKQSGEAWFTVNSVSDIFEVVLRYEPLEAGEHAHLKLFISDFVTNAAIDSAKIEITAIEDDDLKFEVFREEAGIYMIEGVFPANQDYSLVANISGSENADLMILESVQVGKKLESNEAKEQSENGLFSWRSGMILIFGLLLGVVVTMWIGKNKSMSQRTLGILIIVVAISFPLNEQQAVFAHEGEDHGEKKEKPVNRNVAVDEAEILKETQFLFDVRTALSGYSDFQNALKLYGKIMPVTNGEAKIIAPQNASIVSINVGIGEKVSRGQILAVIAQNFDAAEQIQVATEQSKAIAEYEAAEKELQRLKSIEDIVARKDLIEAEIRYKTALKNKRVYDNLSGNHVNGKTLSVTSPIAGVIDNFDLAIGQQVGQGEKLFSVFDITKLKVVAQIFDRDLHKLHHPDIEGVMKGVKFFVECIQEEKHYSESAKLIAFGSVVNPVNQSSEVILELDNSQGLFKPGQFANVYVTAKSEKNEIVVPASAIIDINGKPVVFVHTSPEIFKLKFVQLGESSNTQTIVIKGLEEKERVVVNGTYQVKSIYLNQ
ncbi:MAG TPA: efflux RND transporter periplasmic adaptor subunit [Flavobacteriales bacterium]|nr:efflux RND transporter periplasmic adaptor subunit [Flavobacteriales bacterium]